MAVLLFCFLVVLFHPSMQMQRNGTDKVQVVVNWQHPLSPINEQLKYVNASRTFIQHVNLGDVLVFHCPNGSFANLFYLETLNQYDACDCSKSDGRCLKQGECLGEEDNLIVRVQEVSESLASVIPFAPNRNFYFTSFSDGLKQDDSTSNRDRDGRCLVGLKIVVHVNDSTPDPLETSSVVVPLPTPSPTPAVVTTTDGPVGLGCQSKVFFRLNICAVREKVCYQSPPPGERVLCNTRGTVPEASEGATPNGSGDVNIDVTEDPSVDLPIDEFNQTITDVSGVSCATNLGCSQLLTYMSVVACALLAVALRY